MFVMLCKNCRIAECFGDERLRVAIQLPRQDMLLFPLSTSSRLALKVAYALRRTLFSFRTVMMFWLRRRSL